MTYILKTQISSTYSSHEYEGLAVPIPDPPEDLPMPIERALARHDRNLTSAELEQLPKQCFWEHPLPPPDWRRGSYYQAISEPFRQIVEALDPNVHQFKPITLLGPSGAPRPWQYYLWICKGLNAINESGTQFFINEYGVKLMRTMGDGCVTVDAKAVAGLNFWTPQSIAVGMIFISDKACDLLVKSKMTGFRLIKANDEA